MALKVWPCFLEGYHRTDFHSYDQKSKIFPVKMSTKLGFWKATTHPGIRSYFSVSNFTIVHKTEAGRWYTGQKRSYWVPDKGRRTTNELYKFEEGRNRIVDIIYSNGFKDWSQVKHFHSRTVVQWQPQLFVKEFSQFQPPLKRTSDVPSMLNPVHNN